MDLLHSTPARVGKWLLLPWMAVVIWAAFRWAPAAEGFGETSRIVFFHVPMAWTATIAFVVSGIASIRYLAGYEPRHDAGAAAAAGLGLMFAILATATGSVFAELMWGSYWNWDPRQTSITVLLLIYAAYFALRGAVDDPERRATLAAGYAILAMATVPFLMFVVPRVYESLHPDTLLSTDFEVTPDEMDGRILTVLLGSVAGFTAIFMWLYALASRVELARRSADAEEIT